MWILIPVGALGAALGWRFLKRGRERKLLARRVVDLSAKYMARKASALERVELHDASKIIGLPAIAEAVKGKKKVPAPALEAAKRMAA